MKVIVLGAGVIGVTTAYFLARAGHQVTVLEKNSAPAMGCSFGNGAQLSYSHVETWAAKAFKPAVVKEALLPSSFLSISDFSNKKFLNWFYEFYKNSKSAKAHQNSAKLFSLSSYSKDLLEHILSEEGALNFDYKPGGILHFYRSQKKFDQALKEAEVYSKIGCKMQVLNAEECLKKEPSLVKIFDEKKLAGGILCEDDAIGDSVKFTKALEYICKNKYGVVFEYNVDIKNILNNRKKITGINTDKGVFIANKYVYALGSYGVKMLEGIGINSKIYPLKGYSLSMRVNEEFIAPSFALSDIENKIVYSRIGDIFRTAGAVEICDLRPSRNKKIIGFMKKTISATFSDFGNFNQVEEWFGFRPFRPNSIPLICEAKKYDNLLLNTGHGSLGWTLAAASGKILSDLASNQKDERFGFLEEELV